MFNGTKNISLNKVVNFLFCLFPISFIVGSLIVTLNLYLFLILSIVYIKKKNYKVKFNYTNSILVTFFLFIIISSFINIDSIKHDYALKSILLFRFALLYLVIETLLINNNLNLKNFFTSSLMCVSFVSFDLIVQYLAGYDLLGYKSDTTGAGERGVFGNEGIAGGYIQKFSLFAIFGFLLFFNKNKYKKQILFFLVLAISLGAFFATNRMSFLILIFSLIILFFIFKEIRFVIITSLIAFFSIAAVTIDNDEILKKRYHNLIERFASGKKQVEKYSAKIEEEDKSKTKRVLYISSNHFQIYATAFESWKKKPILGQGHKSFRRKCEIKDSRITFLENIKKEKKNFHFQCSTHPHNYHLEILHDYGVIGFAMISFFVFMKLFEVFKRIKNKPKINNYFIYLIPIVLSLLIEIWPLKSTGRLFGTWNGTTVWLVIALTSITKINFDEKKIIRTFENQNYLFLFLFVVLFVSLLIEKNTSF